MAHRLALAPVPGSRFFLGGAVPEWEGVECPVLGKEQMGSALMGSLQISFFWQRDFLGTPVNRLLFSQKCQGVPFFPNLSKYITFAAVPLVLIPFVRNQSASPWNASSVRGPRPTASLRSEKGEVLLSGVGTLRYLLILGENSACQVPICAVAAWWFDNPHPKVVPRSQIPRSTSHLSYQSAEFGATFVPAVADGVRGSWRILIIRTQGRGLRPISLLRVSLLRLLDSNLPGSSLWTWEFHPVTLRFCLS